MVIYYFLRPLFLCLWYSTTFYWLPVYTYGTLLPSTGYLPIPLVLYYLLLAPCLSLWNSSIFYWPTDYPYCTKLSSTNPLPVSMVLYYLLLAPCLSLWYSIIFYCPTAYTYVTLLSSNVSCQPFGTLLTSTCHMPIPLVLYYLLLVPCLYLWYSTVFYCPAAYTYGTLLISNGPCLFLW